MTTPTLREALAQISVALEEAEKNSARPYVLEGLAELAAAALAAQPEYASSKAKWPKTRRVGRMGDMTPLGESNLCVGFDADNDVYVSVFNQSRGTSDIEFCTRQGGGRSPRTRQALIALMVAMEEDSKATPALACPPTNANQYAEEISQTRTVNKEV